MANFINLTGMKYGRLSVKEIDYRENYRTYWKCLCECGKTCIVEGGNLRSGRQKSCGCYKTDLSTARLTKHGMNKTRLHTIWVEMRRRCNNHKDSAYVNYGGRGITVCNEWERFEPFMEWAIKEGYRESLSLDRVDNDKGYEPGNCRWATRIDQGNNKRNNVVICHNGISKTLSEWSREVGVPYKTLYSRHVRNQIVLKELKEEVDK